MKKRWAGLVVAAVLLFSVQPVKAWQPLSWVWFQWPYAFDYQENLWYYMDTGGTAYLYSFAGGTWSLSRPALFVNGLPGLCNALCWRW
jgi:hypothetical protein